VGSSSSSVSYLGTIGRMDIQTAQRALVPLYLAGNQDKPYPIMVATLGPFQSPDVYYPYEFTPLYAGAPGVSVDPVAGTVGGGFMESLALNSPPPNMTRATTSPDGTKVGSCSCGLVWDQGSTTLKPCQCTKSFDRAEGLQGCFKENRGLLLWACLVMPNAHTSHP